MINAENLTQNQKVSQFTLPQKNHYYYYYIKHITNQQTTITNLQINYRSGEINRC